MDDAYRGLIRSATDKGVELTGVEPRSVRGTDIGMFATRQIQVTGPPIASLSG